MYSIEKISENLFHALYVTDSRKKFRSTESFPLALDFLGLEAKSDGRELLLQDVTLIGFKDKPGPVETKTMPSVIEPDLMAFPIDPDGYYPQPALDVPQSFLNASNLADARKSGKLRYALVDVNFIYKGQWLIDWLDSIATGGSGETK